MTMTPRIIMIATQTTNAPNRRRRFPRRAGDQGAVVVMTEMMMAVTATMTTTNGGTESPTGLAGCAAHFCSTDPPMAPSSLAKKQRL